MEKEIKLYIGEVVGSLILELSATKSRLAKQEESLEIYKKALDNANAELEKLRPSKTLLPEEVIPESGSVSYLASR